MIRNIIFDIGNVLADFRWREFLADKGFLDAEIDRLAAASVLTPAWGELDRGAIPFDRVMDGFIQNDPELEKELHRAFDNMEKIVALREYALPWIRSLKAKGFGVYYLSNFSEKIERECKESLVFLPEMDGGILSYREKLIKPDPAIYQCLLQRYGLKGEECLFLDDTPVNVRAALEQGIHGIVFHTKEEAAREAALKYQIQL